MILVTRRQCTTSTTTIPTASAEKGTGRKPSATAKSSGANATSGIEASSVNRV
jgi:hypothetical protein